MLADCNLPAQTTQQLAGISRKGWGTPGEAQEGSSCRTLLSPHTTAQTSPCWCSSELSWSPAPAQRNSGFQVLPLDRRSNQKKSDLVLGEFFALWEWETMTLVWISVFGNVKNSARKNALSLISTGFVLNKERPPEVPYNLNCSVILCFHQLVRAQTSLPGHVSPLCFV